MNDKLKHLEFIQNIVTRMAGNSFFTKGWSLTLTAALVAVAVRGRAEHVLLIALLPLIVFWALDGFFLAQERQYRALYNEVAAKPLGNIDFSLNASGYNNKERTWGNSSFSTTLRLFHGALLLGVFLCWVFFPKLTSGAPQGSALAAEASKSTSAALIAPQVHQSDRPNKVKIIKRCHCAPARISTAKCCVKKLPVTKVRPRLR